MLTFREFAEFCNSLEKVSSTLEMTAKIAGFLRKIEDDRDLYDVVLFLMGKVYPPWDERELGVGIGLVYEALKIATGVEREKIEDLLRETGDLGKAAEILVRRRKQLTLFQEELTIRKVREVFDTISTLTGEGSQKRKVRLLADLYVSATPVEAKFLTRLVLGEMRLGVGEGIIRDAIAKAWGISSELVERAYMITNDFGRVAVVAKNEGRKGLEKMKIQLHIPVRMMLAQVAEGIDSAIREMGKVAVEWKFDGTRVQIHWGNGKVTIFSRRLENVTNALPEVVEEVKKAVKEGVILDGEAVAIKDDRPLPFQHILRRFRRKHEVSKILEKVPIKVFLFDVLFANNEETIDLPLKERRAILESLVSESERIVLAEQRVTDSVEEIEEIYHQALDAGHEGVMMKNPNSPYIPGKRGKHWLKLKPVMENLDLVVVGGEWGEGKRSHVISSFELACLDEHGRLLRVGKVATGFTDEELEELTELFKPLIEYQEGKKVRFQPKYIFEVAYQEIQKSPKYESGFALRFPRFVRLREDKSVEEADTIERIARLYEAQFKSKKSG